MFATKSELGLLMHTQMSANNNTNVCKYLFTLLLSTATILYWISIWTTFVNHFSDKALFFRISIKQLNIMEEKNKRISSAYRDTFFQLTLFTLIAFLHQRFDTIFDSIFIVCMNKNGKGNRDLFNILQWKKNAYKFFSYKNAKCRIAISPSRVYIYLSSSYCFLFCYLFDAANNLKCTTHQ
jgi:hypothetical protein